MTAGAPLAIVYDLDDTLYPEEEYARSALGAVGALLAEELGVDDLAERLIRCFEQGERRKVYDRVLAELGRHDLDVLVPRMIELHRAHKPILSLYPDADESLRYWRPRARLGILSDGFLAAQHAKVAALGLESRVDVVLFTDRRGRRFWKPHPWAFEQMAADLGVPQERCVYVADNPAKDFVAPNALGWKSIWVQRAGGVYADQQPAPGGEPSFSIRDLGDVPGLLAGWM